MSNTRRLKPKPRDPDATEAAFRDQLKGEGCPHCGSRVVTGKLRNGTWDYGLMCEPGCRTHTEPLLAHRLASEAVERAGLATGERLSYRAVDSMAGVGGVVVG